METCKKCIHYNHGAGEAICEACDPPFDDYFKPIKKYKSKIAARNHFASLMFDACELHYKTGYLYADEFEDHLRNLYRHYQEAINDEL